MAFDYWSQFRTIQQAFIDTAITSGMSQRNPLLALWLGRAMMEGPHGRPPAFQVQGGQLVGISNVRRQVLVGKSVLENRIKTGDFGGGRAVGAYGTLPTATNTRLFTKTRCHWTKFAQPLKIWQHELDANQGPTGVGNFMRENADSAVDEAERMVTADIWSGVPTDQDEEEWDGLLGIRLTLDDGTTYATYCNRNRTTLTATDRSGTVTYPLKPALFSATGVGFSFGLIDDVQKATINGMVDLVLVNKDLFYGTCKPLAEEKGTVATFVSSGSSLPEFGLVSFQWDLIRYGRTIIIPDPYCPAGEAAGTSIMACLSLSDWDIQVHPAYAFRLGRFREPSNGDDDAVENRIQSKLRQSCRKIFNQGLYTNVS